MVDFFWGYKPLKKKQGKPISKNLISLLARTK